MDVGFLSHRINDDGEPAICPHNEEEDAVFYDISNASESREGKQVNGVVKMGPKKNNPINGWAPFESISYRFVVECNTSHNGMGKDVLPVSYKVARTAISSY